MDSKANRLLLFWFMNILIKVSTQYSEIYNGLVYKGLVFYVPNNNTMGDGKRATVSLSYSESQIWCEKDGATLAILGDREAQEMFPEIINNISDSSKLRIGGRYNSTDTWTWISGNPLKGIDVKYPDKFSEASKGYFYGIAWIPDGIYARVNQRRYFICEYSGDRDPCVAKRNNKCYKEITKGLHWYEARNVCLDDGGDLATFESLDQSTLSNFWRNLSLADRYMYWIGIQRGVWQWINTGAEMKYTNWSPSHPNDYTRQCLCLDRQNNWKWITCDCNEPIPFICSINASSLTTEYPPSNAAPIIGAVVCIVLVAIAIVLLFVIRFMKSRRKNSNSTKSTSVNGATRNSYSKEHEIRKSQISLPVKGHVTNTPVDRDVYANSASVQPETMSSTEEKSTVYASVVETQSHPENHPHPKGKNTSQHKNLIYADLEH